MKSANCQLLAVRQTFLLYRMLSPWQLHVKREIASQTLLSGDKPFDFKAVFVGFSLSSLVSAEAGKTQKFSEISSFLGSATPLLGWDASILIRPNRSSARQHGFPQVASSVLWRGHGSSPDGSNSGWTDLVAKGGASF
jgi:hypothetical protein